MDDKYPNDVVENAPGGSNDPCLDINSCAQCVAKSGCGWATVRPYQGYCLTGTAAEPTSIPQPLEKISFISWYWSGADSPADQCRTGWVTVAGTSSAGQSVLLSSNDGGQTFNGYGLKNDKYSFAGDVMSAGVNGSINDVVFPPALGATVGYAVGDKSLLIATANGGATWTTGIETIDPQSTTGTTIDSNLVDIDCLEDGSVCLAGGNNATTVYLSGGVWSVQKVAVKGLTIANILAAEVVSKVGKNFRDEDAYEHDGSLLIVGNADNSVRAVVRASPDVAKDGTGFEYGHIKSVEFTQGHIAKDSFAFSLNKGVLVSGKEVWHTKDSGVTWTAATAVPTNSFLFAATWTSDSNVVGVGFDGKVKAVVVASSDGGATWTSTATNFSGMLGSVGFVYPTTLVAAGADSSDGTMRGLVIRSTDSGATWKKNSGQGKTSVSSEVSGLTPEDRKRESVSKTVGGDVFEGTPSHYFDEKACVCDVGLAVGRAEEDKGVCPGEHGCDLEWKKKGSVSDVFLASVFSSVSTVGEDLYDIQGGPGARLPGLSLGAAILCWSMVFYFGI